MNKITIDKMLKENKHRLDYLISLQDEISTIRQQYNLSESPLQTDGKSESKYQKGISVIIPSYRGEDVIEKCLLSLVSQTLDSTLFDIVVILNGENDKASKIIKNFVDKHQVSNIFVYHSNIANASLARNIGIEKSNREYIVFVDDDDYVSNNYLEEMYRYANPDTVVFSQIVDVDITGEKTANNVINKQIERAAKKGFIERLDLSMVLTINACKLIPTTKLKKIRYDVTLKSGEDIVFFTDFFVKNAMKLHVIDIEKNVIYYRVLRKDSVSRKKMSFEFNVDDRLKVIALLNKILSDLEIYQQEEVNFVKNKIKAQSSFIRKYLEMNPNDKGKVANAIRSQRFNYFPYELINENEAKTLIIAYCFPPYSDTSANVMAKRIREQGDVVDVVYNKMDRVRSIDEKTNILVDDLIDQRFEIPSYSSFSSWKPIEDFVEMGMKKIDKSKKYSTIYSRSMWPGSHFLAFEYKRNNPEVKWIAEFSDPIRFDIEGKERYVQIDSKKFLKRIKRFTKKGYGSYKWKSDNLFFWCEYLPYLFAEKLIFTNDHQLQYMLNKIPHNDVQSIVEEKAVVSRHPTLENDFYNVEISDYELDKEKINIAYFGNFYKTRNLNELFIGLDKVDEDIRSKVVLHIFTSNPSELENDILVYDSNNQIVCNNYVNYFEFLNLTLKFDCLVVNDAVTKGILPINPFLPSKLSDYLGSKNKIWAIYEPGSVLSQLDLPYKSELGNIDQIVQTYEQIILDAKNV